MLSVPLTLAAIVLGSDGPECRIADQTGSSMSASCRSALPEAIAACQRATHRCIRRQLTWFRADERIHWIDAEGDAASRAHVMTEA